MLLGFLDERFCITPGFAELGSRQETEHFKLGKAAAKVSNYVFLVGDDKRIGSIRKGLLEENFPAENIF